MDFSHILTDSYTLTLTCILVASLAVLSLYYGLFYMTVGRYKGPRTKKKEEAQAASLPPVSVVLTAQNDDEKLRANLLYILEQDYPTFEVVVVDYRSTDDSKFVLQMLAQTYSNLKVVRLEANANGYQGMKYPFSIGIKSAKYDVLMLTDPECMPKDVTNFCWLREMVAGYVGKNTEVVLGFCGIQGKRSPFNWLQQYDNLDYSAEYLGAAIHHRPFTGCGRNLSYRRSLFMKSGGFIYHYHVPDGADDMFVNQNATRRNTSVVLSDGSFTTVQPQRTLGEWHTYRRHRAATHRYYGTRLKFNRMMRPLGVLLFYLSAALLLAGGKFPWEVLAGVLLLKLAWQIVATAKVADRLDIKPVVYWLSPLFEIYFLIANTISRIIPLSKKK
jgi:hypothetical protein